MKRPNDYQSISDFMLNLVRRLYERGQCFAVAVRNSRGEINELHLMREGVARIAEDGRLDFARSYDIDVGNRTMWWMGMVGLAG